MSPPLPCPPLAAGSAQGDGLAAELLVGLDGHQRRRDVEGLAQRFAREIEGQAVVLQHVLLHGQVLEIGQSQRRVGDTGDLHAHINGKRHGREGWWGTKDRAARQRNGRGNDQWVGAAI